MTTKKTKKMKGANLSNEERIYTFQLMDAETGGRIYHQNAYLFPILEEILFGEKDDEKGKKEAEEKTFLRRLVDAVHMFPDVVVWDRVTDVCGAMLSNATVEIDGTVHELGESGIGEYMQGDPGEIYTALFYAACANYPKYLSLFLEIGEDSSQPTKETAPK